MEKFRKTWNGRAVEDDGCYMSKEAKSFVTAFRNMLKRELGPAGFNVVYIKAGHYDLHGFLEKEGRFYYVSYSIPRYGMKIDLDATGFATGVLYRTAKSEKDYTGGGNHFCPISQLPDELKFLDARQARIGIA